MSDDEYYKIPPEERTNEAFDEMRKDWGNNTLVGWKLVYSDGSEITSRDMAFVDAPQDGVQVLVKYYRRAKGGYSKEIQNGLDMYVLFSEQPLFMELPPEIKKGENLSGVKFHALLDAVRQQTDVVTEMQDADLHTKS